MNLLLVTLLLPLLLSPAVSDAAAINLFDDVVIADEGLRGAEYVMQSSSAGGDDDDEAPTTDKCNKFEFQEFVQDQVSCASAEAAAVQEALASFADVQDVWAALCRQYTKQIQCAEEKGLTCWSEKQLAVFRTNTIARRLETAANNTDILGNAFVRSCPLLREGRDEVVKAKTGSNRCSYPQFLRVEEETDKCISEAAQARDQRLSFFKAIFGGLSRDQFVGAICDERRQKLSVCMAITIGACVDDGDEAALSYIRDDLQGSLDDLDETVARVIGEPGFKLPAEECGDLSFKEDGAAGGVLDERTVSLGRR